MADSHAANDATIIELYSDVVAAVMTTRQLAGDNRQLCATRAGIAQTLRWAAQQFHPAGETAQLLRLWAGQVDHTVPCKCGGLYRSDEPGDHFAAVVHDWADIPDRLRGLPAGGRGGARLN